MLHKDRLDRLRQKYGWFLMLLPAKLSYSFHLTHHISSVVATTTPQVNRVFVGWILWSLTQSVKATYHDVNRCLLFIPYKVKCKNIQIISDHGFSLYIFATFLYCHFKFRYVWPLKKTTCECSNIYTRTQ